MRPRRPPVLRNARGAGRPTRRGPMRAGMVLAELRDTPPADLPMDADAAVAERLRRAPMSSPRRRRAEADRRRVAERRGTLPDVGLSGGYKGTGGFATAQFGVISRRRCSTPTAVRASAPRASGCSPTPSAVPRILRAANEVRAALDAAARDGCAHPRVRCRLPSPAPTPSPPPPMRRTAKGWRRSRKRSKPCAPSPTCAPPVCAPSPTVPWSDSPAARHGRARAGELP
jgi:hypothetical protein